MNPDLSVLWHQGSLPYAVGLFELDIKAMLPSLDMQDVWVSINEIACVVSRAPGPTGKPRRGTLRFALNRIDSQLDRMGSGSPNPFHNVTIDLCYKSCATCISIYFITMHSSLPTTC